MRVYTLQASLEERARKKNPALDIVAPHKAAKFDFPRLVLVKPSHPVGRAVLSDISIASRPVNQTVFSETTGKNWRFLLGRTIQWLIYRGRLMREYMGRIAMVLLPRFSRHKMLYASLVGGVAFGMVSMAFIEHAFGPGVFARSEESSTVIEQKQPERVAAVLGEAVEVYDPNQDIFFEYFGQVTKERYEESIRDMVKGYPVEAMLPYIFEQDRLTAAFLIGIAKKESNWGKRVPVLEDQDCFNYWGYRGVRRMMGSGGHTCFNSRKDAVETVAKRLNTLINSEQLDTPEKMIVWKCGFSCQGHSRESVRKWIADVDMYFSQLSDE